MCTRAMSKAWSMFFLPLIPEPILSPLPLPASMATLGTVSSAAWNLPSRLGWVTITGSTTVSRAILGSDFHTNGSGVDFNVVFRRYPSMGFGLPMQITALNQPVLARPGTLDIQQGGSMLPIQPTGWPQEP